MSPSSSTTVCKCIKLFDKQPDTYICTIGPQVWTIIAPVVAVVLLLVVAVAAVVIIVVVLLVVLVKQQKRKYSLEKVSVYCLCTVLVFCV